MKANEAPEKLYFDVNNNLIGLYDSAILGMFSAKNTETAIEYTLTSAFIEKARGWFEKRPEQYDANGVRLYSTEDFEDFVNSMQEEPVNKVDVDAAMAEVEAKAKTHKGESSDEILAQMRGEEPVSEDLEKASKEWLEPQLDKSYVSYGEDKMMELTHFDGYAMLDAIEFGANWQKEQMVASGTDVTVHVDAGGYPYIPQIELYDYDKDIPLAKEGDKYKVVLIKEE